MLDAAPSASVRHVPFVYYHRRRGEVAASPEPASEAREERRRAVNEHLTRTGQAAVALPAPQPAGLRIRRAGPGPPPLVSLVVATRDEYEVLRTCVNGLLNRTDYDPIELVVVDYGSTEPDPARSSPSCGRGRTLRSSRIRGRSTSPEPRSSSS
jgi:hypothetical protein